MSDIKWDLNDPTVKTVDFEQDKAGHWNVIITLRERWRDSMGNKVVNARLIHEGLIMDKDLAWSTWTPAVTRTHRGAKPSEGKLILTTESEDYPDKVKVEIEVSDA